MVILHYNVQRRNIIFIATDIPIEKLQAAQSECKSESEHLRFLPCFLSSFDPLV